MGTSAAVGSWVLNSPFKTHWGRVTHICVGKLIIIGSDNGLSPDRRQAIIWTNAGLLSIGPLRTYFSENLIKIQQFSSEKLHVKMSSAKWRPSCPGLNVLNRIFGWLRAISNCRWVETENSYPGFYNQGRSNVQAVYNFVGGRDACQRNWEMNKYSRVGAAVGPTNIAAPPSAAT